MNIHKSKAVFDELRAYESRNVTFMEPDGSWPIVWERASGVNVWDTEGRKYLDLTAAFGVAAAGHANPRVVRAGQAQMARLLHAMGDVHPHALKARLARELSRLTFERWGERVHRRNPRIEPLNCPRARPSGTLSPSEGERDGVRGLFRGRKGCAGRTSGPPTDEPQSAQGKTIFCNSGFEAVEAALKTAALATGKPGVIAFKGAYHGLGYGALNVTHRAHFRSPFIRQLAEFGSFVPFPAAEGGLLEGRTAQAKAQRRALADLNLVETKMRQVARRKAVGAVLVEPIQVRGGTNIPPPGFLQMLRDFCTGSGVLLVLDEIYTGFGRTGAWFACEHEGVQPDLICLGKALTGGFPLAACVGRADLMDAAWPPSSGEAIHTSTFLGHPVGCAMAVAQLEEIQKRGLVRRSAQLGKSLLSALAGLEVRVPRACVRGQGLLAGVELRLSDGRPATAAALAAVKAALHCGYIFLPEGEFSNVISLTPPLTISEGQLKLAVAVLADLLKANGN